MNSVFGAHQIWSDTRMYQTVDALKVTHKTQYRLNVWYTYQSS